MGGELRIEPARDAADFALGKVLFGEYAQSLGIDLGFQHFEEELSALSTMYAPPGGLLLLAYSERAAVGCGAFRALEPGICEMKRLYVRPGQRGLQAGRRLAEALVAAALDADYARMRLDTLPSMQQAIGLYRSLGFKSIAPYYDTPIENTVFMELELTTCVARCR